MKDGVELVFLPIIWFKYCNVFFLSIILYNIDLVFIIQFLLDFVEFSQIISQFAVSQPVRCDARLINHSFCPISFNHTVLQYLIHLRSLDSFNRQFLNRCMCINNWKKQFNKFMNYRFECFLIITSDQEIFLTSFTWES